MSNAAGPLVGSEPATAREPSGAATLAVEPVTPEEVEALARRIRVEAKLGRITVVGTALGLVCGAAAAWPFLGRQGYMVESLTRSGDLAPFGFFAAWLLAGLLPLLAFYAGRLHFQSGRSTTGEIETGLRKLRRVILGCMFTSIVAFVVVLGQRQSGGGLFEGATWTTLTYAACFAACASVVGDVRRGLGDFDTEHQRRRRKLARGFAVELRPAAASAGTQDAIPLATRAGRGVPALTPGEGPAPIPVPVLPVAPVPEQSLLSHPTPALPASPATPAHAGEDEHARDLRLLLTLAVAVAIALYAVRLGNDLPGAVRQAEYFGSWLSGTLWPVPASLDWPTSALVMLARAATVLLAPCAVLWLVWGILSLNYGMARRRAVGWLTAVTLVLAALCVLPGWVYGVREVRDPFADRLDLGMLARAPEIVHALFLGLLLTRPGVQRLFARDSRIDDID